MKDVFGNIHKFTCAQIHTHTHAHIYTHILCIHKCYLFYSLFPSSLFLSTLISHNLLHSFSLHNLVHLQKLRYWSEKKKKKKKRQEKRKANMLNQKRRFYNSICDSLHRMETKRIPLRSPALSILYMHVSCTCTVNI